ncbi:flagellar basal body-associated protein FliL [Parashewanella tropica]|uniref:flagellar basal body-associated protein FliL n=1 Tax=Parashewanella tropica TaxID=2547970 RepID=UPI001059EE8D|nr:flagellar basal body-associated protein FliL [Parashewanella tropica]
MKTRFWPVMLAGLTLLVSGFFAKAEAKMGEYLYYGFEPEFVTNYISSTRGKLGFVRVGMELMVQGSGDLELVEHHEPLLRSAILEILGQQTGGQVKSITGREDIREACLQRINELLEQETGRPIVTNVLITKYLYN